MGSKKSSAPEYPTYKLDTGLYGTTTSDKKGTTATFTPFQQQLVSTAEQNVPNMLNYMINPTADNPYFQNQAAVRQDLYNKAFENNVVNPLAERNLTRGSSVNALANAYANDIAQQERQALVDSANQAQNVYNTLMGAYSTPYDMLMNNAKFSSSGGQNVANYNLKKYELDQANNNNALWSNIAGAVGTIGGAAVGGPIGANIGNMLAKKGTKMAMEGSIA